MLIMTCFVATKWRSVRQLQKAPIGISSRRHAGRPNQTVVEKANWQLQYSIEVKSVHVIEEMRNLNSRIHSAGLATGQSISRSIVSMQSSDDSRAAPLDSALVQITEVQDFHLIAEVIDIPESLMAHNHSSDVHQCDEGARQEARRLLLSKACRDA